MKMTSTILDYYDREVVKEISEKYSINNMEAFRRFINSETYKMLVDDELEMWEFSPLAIFDMWENEQVTGNPRNSVYIRRNGM